MSSSVLSPILSGGECSLPSGRRVLLQLEQETERIEVHNPDGEVEVVIELTASGPLVRLRGARLVLESTEGIAVQCRDLQIEATERIQMAAEEMKVRTTEDIHMNGATIRLNC